MIPTEKKGKLFLTGILYAKTQPQKNYAALIQQLDKVGLWI
jgi:hypothetical protein